MKNLFLGALILTTLSSWAGDCELNGSIKIVTDWSNGVTYNKVSLDECLRLATDYFNSKVNGGYINRITGKEFDYETQFLSVHYKFSSKNIKAEGKINRSDRVITKIP